jgi:hypothetical protein
LKLILSGKRLERISKFQPKRVGYYELKKHKPWFDEGCSKLLEQKKKAEMQWLQDPNEINGDILNNVRCETSRYFSNKKREYLKDKINELAMNNRTRTSETSIEE